MRATKRPARPATFTHDWLSHCESMFDPYDAMASTYRDHPSTSSAPDIASAPRPSNLPRFQPAMPSLILPGSFEDSTTRALDRLAAVQIGKNSLLGKISEIVLIPAIISLGVIGALIISRGM